MFLWDKISSNISNSPASAPPTSIMPTESISCIQRLSLVSNLFTLPSKIGPLTATAPIHRVMSLNDPTSKMSKSSKSERSRILITDTPEQIKKKVSSAVTDSISGISYDAVERPGISNLLDILSMFDPKGRAASELGEAFHDLSPKQLKDLVSDHVVSGLDGIRQRYTQLLSSDQSYLDKVEAEGTRKAQKSAADTMELVREAMGMWSPKRGIASGQAT